MNPVSAHAQSYRSYERLDVSLPAGCTAIVGANGSGKSSLLEMIPLALFGAPNRSFSDYLRTGDDELVIEFVFEHRDDLYRIRRQFSAKGRGKTSVDFEKWVGAGDYWEPLSRETSAATQDAVSSLIGLSRETFLASAFLSQGQGGVFCEAPPSQRKSILAEILNLSVWDRLHDRARADIRTVEDEIVGLRERAAIAQETAARRMLAEENVGALRVGEAEDVLVLERYEQILANARDAIAETQAAVERAKRCESEYETASQLVRLASDRVSDAQVAAAQRVTKQAELNEAAALAERVEDLQAQVDELREMKTRADAALAERGAIEKEWQRRHVECNRRLGEESELNEKAERLRLLARELLEGTIETEHCDRCGQTLGEEARQRAADSYQGEANDLDAKAELIGEWVADEKGAIAALIAQAESVSVPEVVDPMPVEAALAQARAAGERRAVLAVLVQGYAEKAAVLPRLEAELEHAEAAAREKARALDEAREAVGDIDSLRAAATAASEAVATARARLDETRARIAREQVELERCVAAEVELTEAVEAHRLADERLDLLKVAERAFGRDGIPALIVEASAIPQIELEANRILEAMPMSDGRVFHVELRTQRALKTADHLRETLDIVIYVGSDARPYETFSGGERGRLNIALRIALAKLLAHRRGAESRVLAIDEIPYLDVLGQQQLVDVVNGLGSTFDRIYVVAHEAMLRDAFDRTIEVVTDGERSHVVDGTADVLALAASGEEQE